MWDYRMMGEVREDGMKEKEVGEDYMMMGKVAEDYTM